MDTNQKPRSAGDLTLSQQISLLSGGSIWRTQALPADGVPAVTLSDGPHGLRFQADAGDHLGLASSAAATCFPPAVTVASSWDEELAAEIGRAVAREARALGVDVVLGPGLNIKRHPRCGRNFEYFSEDPLLTGRLAEAMVHGIQSQGVGACLKHFAVNNQESHRFVVDAIVDERTLRELYLAGFEHAVRASKPWTVMAAYNSINGASATVNKRLLTDILRDEWGFEGLVMSDWGATGDRVAAIEAGMDLEMPGSCGISDDDVLGAVQRGRLDPVAVETSAQRVLDLVARSARAAGSSIPTDDHDALARRAAAEGTVLLRNDGLLPLRPNATVAVIGAFAAQPRYQGSGSSLVTPTRVTTALGALRERGVDPLYAPGYDPSDSGTDASLVEQAVEIARQADVALVMVGLPPSAESEGFDREHLHIPDQHNHLVEAVCAANPKTVVALSNGAPILMPWTDSPAAILESYLGGQASGGALIDVLFGDAEPGGRLAETFPSSCEEIAADPFFPGRPRQVEYREGLFVGYRHHTSADITPAFPFGHGIGYTTFHWSDIATSHARLDAGKDTSVTLTVTNTGTRTGSDVVQIYLHDRTGVVLRPRRTLAGFAKVKLAAGESRPVTIDIPARAFAFYDVDNRDWRIPTGVFGLEVARSSADIVETVDVEITGGVNSAPESAHTAAVATSSEAFRRRLGHPVPEPRPAQPFSRESTIGELTDGALGRLLKAAFWKFAPLDNSSRNDKALMAMLQRGLEELPVRAAANFSRGRLRWPTVDILIDLANRDLQQAASRVLAGLQRLLKGRP